MNFEFDSIEQSEYSGRKISRQSSNKQHNFCGSTLMGYEHGEIHSSSHSERITGNYVYQIESENSLI